VTVKAEYEALFLIQWGILLLPEVEGVEETGPLEEAWVHQEPGEPVNNFSMCTAK
jgi:hypothetical protein